jgi:hypothetical protein
MISAGPLPPRWPPGLGENIVARVLNHASEIGKTITGAVYIRHNFAAEKRHALEGSVGGRAGTDCREIISCERDLPAHLNRFGELT